MKGTILLNYQEDTKKVEEEEKARFLRNLIEQMGIPVDEFWVDDKPLTPEQKIKLRGILMAYGVKVIDSLDGEMQIYVEGEKVGSWDKSTYKIKRDLREVDPRKQYYLEMTVSFWSIFEDQQI